MELQLRCSHKPESGSTRLNDVLASGRGAKIITSLDEVLLIELEFGHGTISHVFTVKLLRN